MSSFFFLLWVFSQLNPYLLSVFFKNGQRQHFNYNYVNRQSDVSLMSIFLVVCGEMVVIKSTKNNLDDNDLPNKKQSKISFAKTLVNHKPEHWNYIATEIKRYTMFCFILSGPIRE